MGQCQTLIKHKADVTMLSERILHVAAFYGKVDVVLSLINEFAFDPSPVGADGCTPLHIASLKGHSNLVQILLRFASPLLTDNFGNTPLHLASKANQFNCVKALVDANAPLFIRNSEGGTPTDVATGSSRTFLAEYIKENRTQLQAGIRPCQKKILRFT